jgi:N-sulfoglucosamine sulfohydrolase
LQGDAQRHRDAIYTTHSGDGEMNVYPIRSIRTGDWKLIWNLHPEFAHTTHIDKALARDGGRYWISWFEKAKTDPAAAAIVRRYHQRPALELFDLQADPHEQRNLADDPRQAERVARMRKELETWMASQGDSQQVFNTPRLLTEPASIRPGDSAGK